MLQSIQQSAEQARQIKFQGAKDNLETNFYMGIPTATDQARDFVQSNNKDIEHKNQVDKLQEVIDGLKKQQKTLTEERDHTILKYEESEVMWT